MSERQRVGAIVVGGGPAGSVSALLLARAGIDVVVLERAEFPREKPCGDCLSAAAGTLLQRLGLLTAIESLGPARLEGWRIRGPGGSGFGASFAGLGGADDLAGSALAVPRARFDQALLRQAELAGAEVRTGATVEDVLIEDGIVRGVRLRHGGSRSELHAPLTIGADGLRSRISRRLHLRGRAPRLRKLSLTTHLRLIDPLPPYGEMHVAGGLCIGIAPVDATGTSANLTVVADSDRFGSAVRSDPAAFLVDALRRFPDLPAQVRDADCGAPLASGPFDLPTRAVYAPGAALVGDAAGYFDPFTGQGIYHAMAGAELLVDAVAAALARGPEVPISALSAYAAAQRRLTAGPRRLQRLIDAVLARPRVARRALLRLRARPRAAHALLAITGDLAPAGSLLSPGLLVSFLLPQPRKS